MKLDLGYGGLFDQQVYQVIMQNNKLTSALLLAAGGSLLAQSSAEAAITTYDENTMAPGGDFGNSFSLRTLLPAGTTTVNGDMEFSGGTDPDFYTYTGLTPGGTFTLDITAGDPSVFYQATFQVLDDAQMQIGATATYSFNDPNGMRQITGTVPATGNLTVDIQQSAEGGGGIPSYTTTLSVVPEPATATLALLGGVIAALVARRRSKARGCISSKES